MLHVLSTIVGNDELSADEKHEIDVLKHTLYHTMSRLNYSKIKENI